MENQTKKQKKKYRTTDPNLFFQVKIKAIKDELLLASLSGSELKVILAIASFINDQNKAYPSQKYLSKLTGLSVSSVSRNVTKLSSKKFLNEYILQVVREREEGSKFANNRYYISTNVGINFGSIEHQVKKQETISHNSQTNNTNTLNKNQILKNNNNVISSKKKTEHITPRSSNLHKLFTREEEETFKFYVELISKDKYFKGDTEHTEHVLLKNIEAMGFENWKHLTKVLKNHPNPFGVLNHIRYCVSKLKLSYEEAWKEWDSKY